MYLLLVSEDSIQDAFHESWSIEYDNVAGHLWSSTSRIFLKSSFPFLSGLHQTYFQLSVFTYFLYNVSFQLIEAGNVFRKYDYGREENQSRYNGSMTPPHFNLSDISTPLYLFYGNGDKLIAEEDVLALTQSLPSCRALHKIDYPGWNHNDFVYAQDAKTLVYDSILNQMQDYLNNATKLDTELWINSL